jgi:hypothetical protein
VPLGLITEVNFDDTFNVNVRGTLFSEGAPLMRDGGSIIVTGSIASAKGFPGLSVYNASKAAKRSAQLLTKAPILSKADVSEGGEGWSDSRIAEALDTSIANILRHPAALVEEGFEAVLTRKYNPDSARPRIFDGVAETKLITLACGPAPEGHARWTLRLLEDKVVELHIVERASDNTIGRADAQKNILKPHLKQHWVIAPDASAAFVANMEDVLEVYQRPRDPACPLVCLDETSKQMIVETREPIAAKPGREARHDYEHARNGVANLFMMFAPLEGWRHVKVTDRHTAIDYAHALKDLSDSIFPTPRRSCWCRIISVPTSPSRSTSPFRRPRRAASSNGSNGIHAQARQLARYGRIRTRRSLNPASGSPHPRQTNPHPRNCRMGATSQHASRQSRLAIHNCRRPR